MSNLQFIENGLRTEVRSTGLARPDNIPNARKNPFQCRSDSVGPSKRETALVIPVRVSTMCVVREVGSKYGKGIVAMNRVIFSGALLIEFCVTTRSETVAFKFA